MREKRKEPWQGWLFLGVVVLLIGSIPVWMGVGKFQLCKYYFSEMNRTACFFTQLPAVMRK